MTIRAFRLLIYFLVYQLPSTVVAQTCYTCTGSTSLNAGLVACFPLDGNANERISATNNGVATNTVATTNRFGRSNAALQFNGSSSKIIFPGSNFALNDYTYSVWVKVGTGPSSGNAFSILSIGNGGTLGDQCILLTNNYGPPTQLGFNAVSYPNPSIYPLPPNMAFTNASWIVGIWYHIVAVRSTAAGKIRIYVNGSMVTETSLAFNTAGYDAPVVGAIGARTPGTGQYFNGTIDNLRIYNRALSNSEVLDLYNLPDDNTFSVNAGSDNTICASDSVQLNATSFGAATYSWSPSTGLNNPNIANPIAKPATTRQYIVTAVNGSCSATDTVNVTVSTNCCFTCTTPDPINSGLLACYPFSGNTNDETNLNGAGTNNGASLSNDRYGNANRAYSFGTNKSIAIPTANLSLNTYTYSTWVKINALPASGTLSSILSIGNNGALGDQTININNNYSGTSGFIASSYRASGADFAVTGVLPTVGVWYHVVSVRDVAANKIKLYVNGVKASESALATPTAGYSTPVLGFIGARTPGGSYFNGTIDDVRIYNRALTDSEIQLLYIQNVPPTITPITDKTICAGDSVQLIASATGATTYSWSPTTGLNNPNIANPIAKPAATQQYILTASNGLCSTTDTVVVTVNTNCCFTCITPDPLNNGLLACYPFNTTTNDASGNNIHGIATNITYTTDRFGNANRAISLNGTSSYVDITNAVFQQNQYSYSVWVNVPSVSAAVRSALSIGTDLTDQALLLSSTNGYAAASWNSDVTPTSGVLMGTAPTLNTWHHLIIMRSNTTLSLYLNGNLVASASVAGKTPGYVGTGYGALIGKRVGSVPQYFLGKIDDVRIYNRILSTTEITQLYLQANIPDITPITDKTICAGDSVQLTATGGTSYLWSPSTGLSSTLISNPYAKPGSTQQYIVTVSNSICAVSDTVVVTPHTTPLTLGAVTPICKGDSIQLSASGFTSYTWTPSTSLSNATIASPYAKPASTTKYKVTGTIGLCSKVDSVTVTVNSIVLDAGLDKPICIGDSVQLTATGATNYRWNTQTTLSDSTIANPFAKPTTTQKYYVTGTVATCTAVDSVTVSVSTINLAAGAGGTICKGDSLQLNATGAASYQWHTKTGLSDSTIANPYAKPTATTKYYVTGKSGACTALDSVTITVPTLNADAGANIQICPGDSVMLQATGGASYNWRYNLTLSDSTIANPYAKPASTTRYYVVVTGGTCSAVDSVTVTVAASILLDAGINKVVCVGDSVQLAPTGGTTYKWRYDLTLSDSTITNPFAKPTVKTKYYVTGTTGSCSALDSVEVDVTTITVDAGINHDICGGDSVQLLATGGTTYRWSYNTTLSDSTIANPYAKPTVNTQYYVTGSNGVCKALDSVTVTIKATVTVDAGSNVQLCRGDSVQLQASGAATYTWLPAAGLSNAGISNPKASPSLTTDYIVKGELLTCADYDTVRVTVNPLPTVDLGPDTTKCIYDVYTFSPTVINADQYLWTPASSLDNATILNPTTQTTIPQLFTLTATNSTTGCSNSDTVLMQINNPKALFTLSDTVAAHAPLVVTISNNSTPSPLSYQWIFDDSIPAYYTTAAPTHTFLFEGRYPVMLRVTDDHGCMDTLTRFVTIRNDMGLFIPNVFSPNSDGLNDVFEVRYDKTNTLLLTGTVWNRWGSKIADFSMPNGNWWNGKVDGIDASSDVYFYIITIVNLQNESSSYHGTVTLLR